MKRCITDLEKNLQSINAELAEGTLRCAELEDQVKIERQLNFPEIMSVLLKCLPGPRTGVLHLPLVISGLDNPRYLIEINLKKNNCFYLLHADGIVSLDLDFKIQFDNHLLRKKVERDPEELQSNSSSSDSGSDSRNESQYNSYSSDENINVSSKISKKPKAKPKQNRSDRKANVKRHQDRKRPTDREKVSMPIKERHHLQNEKTKAKRTAQMLVQ